MDSLSRQTMAPSEFEVVLVDDGSPDDTFARCKAYEAAWPNVKAIRIENSGWPCRPRNVGTGIAQGEYVVYSDHDDVLFPRALASGYQWAHEWSSDVLNGREVRTNDLSWGVESFISDVPQLLGPGRIDNPPLVPQTVHKMYRREFLDAHQIRFLEEDVVFFEDVLFNIRACRYASTISTLSSTPFYHWCANAGSASRAYKRESEEYWYWIRRIFQATESELGDGNHEELRLAQMTFTYRTRILGAIRALVDPKVADGVKRRIFQYCRGLVDDFRLDELRNRLPDGLRHQSFGLAHWSYDEMFEVLSHDVNPGGGVSVRSLEWRDGALQIEADVDWGSGGSSTANITHKEGRVVRRVPTSVRPRVPSRDLNMKPSWVTTTAVYGYRQRDSRAAGLVPSGDSRFERCVTKGVDDHGWPLLRVSGRFDPGADASGEPFQNGIYDLNCRWQTLGVTRQKQLRMNLPSRGWVVSGRLCVAYATQDGCLALHISPGALRATDVLVPTSIIQWECLGDDANVWVGVDQSFIGGDGFARMSLLLGGPAIASANGDAARDQSEAGMSPPLKSVQALLVCGVQHVSLRFRVPAAWPAFVVALGSGETTKRVPYLISRDGMTIAAFEAPDT